MAGGVWGLFQGRRASGILEEGRAFHDCYEAENSFRPRKALRVIIEKGSKKREGSNTMSTPFYYDLGSCRGMPSKQWGQSRRRRTRASFREGGGE